MLSLSLLLFLVGRISNSCASHSQPRSKEAPLALQDTDAFNIGHSGLGWVECAMANSADIAVSWVMG